MAERFGSYEIIRKIAAGGMAEVFLAKKVGVGGFERLVCIKRILPHLGEQEDFITMFRDEARIAANFRHPNIAQVNDIGEHEGAHYIEMEYVRGEDLRRIYNAEVARGRAMPLEPAAQIAMGAAAGLDYAHRQTTIDGRPLGVVHRDVSPQNILVTFEGHVKLVDFGVAKAAVKMNETRSGVLKGKYSYMSPEQASGDPIDARTDIFALGITLYEVTTGVRLFKRENELETLHAVIECQVTPPSEILAGYDGALEAIVMRALANDPDDRYPTAGDMERDLEKFLVGRSHPVGASSLGAYMQDLFAEKLADELLFGGSPWSETHTPTRKGTRELDRSGKSAKKSRKNLESAVDEPTEIDAPPSEVERSSPTDPEPDPWGEKSDKASAGWSGVSGMESGWEVESHSGSASATRAVDASVADSDERTIHGEPSQPAPRVVTQARPRRPRWFPALALGSLIAGVLIGLTLILTSDRARRELETSGPLTIDSEPRGARVQLAGLGADAINARYDGYRTPFVIKEGISVELRLVARFIKDGFEIAEIALPLYEPGVVPRPLFVELTPVQQGAEPGSLTLISRPPGAEVSVDGGRIEGVTPLTDIRVRGGEMHKVELTLRGYRRGSETLFVEPGSRRFVDVALQPLSGEGERDDADEDADAAADGKPSANGTAAEPSAAASGEEGSTAFLNVVAPMKLRVTVGSRFVGETPITRLPLEAGVHRLRLESDSDGFVVRRKVRLTAGRTETIELRPRKGTLALNASPWAWVRLGKEAPAETPVSLQVYEGEYTVVFECPDGKRRREQARVSPGQSAALSVNCRE